jgi:periplasmic divalent cation tolerance protein
VAKQRKKGYVVVLVTCGSRREAEKIAQAVVEARLAACVNVLTAPVRSVYRWKGKVECANEFLLVIKSREDRLGALRAKVESLHSYDVPEFLVLPVAGASPKYLTWLGDSIR